VSRPQTLREVSLIARDEPSDFALALREFLDAFYLDHPQREAQARRIAEPAEIVADAFTDAWIGATGEHLARRWGLRVPAWTLRPEHSRLTGPRFVPDARSLRGMLIVMSPPAFRSRLLFTVAEPLMRARFPRDARRIEMPLRWPPERGEKISPRPS
jgi:hypothetical protein